MIGNCVEMTRGWNLEGGFSSPDGAQSAAEYKGDGYTNVEKPEATGTYDGTQNKAIFPAIAIRGGAYNSATLAGGFGYMLDNAPSSWHYHLGFRCARR